MCFWQEIKYTQDQKEQSLQFKGSDKKCGINLSGITDDLWGKKKKSR